MPPIALEIAAGDFAFAAGHRVAISLLATPKRNERWLAKVLCKANMMRRVATKAGSTAIERT
jgi:hypothetical protein